MILVYGWVDGFGNDTALLGVYDSVKTARKLCEPDLYDHELRYEETNMNEEVCFDYYDAKPLFSKKNS